MGVNLENADAKFKAGQRVRHRASGEIGIVLNVCPGYKIPCYDISLGFDTTDEEAKTAYSIQECLLEPVPVPPKELDVDPFDPPLEPKPSPRTAPVLSGTIEADVFGTIEQFDVLGPIADGLLCRSKDGFSMGIVREAQAVDKEAFRRIMAEAKGAEERDHAGASQ